MDQNQYVKVNIKESVRAELKEQARRMGKTLADYIEWLAGAHLDTDAADAILEKLDKESESQYEDLKEQLDDDELPECCQKIYSGRKTDRCEHWIIKNNRWYNQVTNRYIDDQAYVNYFQNA